MAIAKENEGKTSEEILQNQKNREAFQLKQ